MTKEDTSCKGDALEYVKDLRQAGVPQELAEIHARYLFKVNLADKGDMKDIEAKLESIREQIHVTHSMLTARAIQASVVIVGALLLFLLYMGVKIG